MQAKVPQHVHLAESDCAVSGVQTLKPLMHQKRAEQSCHFSSFKIQKRVVRLLLYLSVSGSKAFRVYIMCFEFKASSVVPYSRKTNRKFLSILSRVVSEVDAMKRMQEWIPETLPYSVFNKFEKFAGVRADHRIKEGDLLLYVYHFNLGPLTKQLLSVLSRHCSATWFWPPQEPRSEPSLGCSLEICLHWSM